MHLHSDKDALSGIAPESLLHRLIEVAQAGSGDIEASIAKALLLARDGVQGTFAAYIDFDAAHGVAVIRHGVALPPGLARKNPLGGTLAYEALVNAGEELVAHPHLSGKVLQSEPVAAQTGSVACIAAPIRLAGFTVGAIAVYDDHPRNFDRTQRCLVAALADLIALTAERRSLEERLAHKRTNDKVLSAVSAQAISTRDASFLDFCLETIGRSFGVDDVSIFWYNAQTGDFLPHQSRWRPQGVVPNPRINVCHLISMPIIRKVVETRAPVLCDDAETITHAATQMFLKQSKVASFLVLPVSSEQQLFGLLTMHMQQGMLKWDNERLDTFMAIAGIIAQWKAARKIADELGESQALIYQLFQLLPTAIYQVDLRSLRFVKVNEQVCRATGYTEEELLSMSADQILTPSSYQLFRERMIDREAGRTLSENVEFEIKTKGGGTEWGHFHIRHLYENGEIWGANVAVHIITEQRKAREELANYRRRLEFLVAERTAELSLANQKLRAEVVRRKETAKELRAKTERLEELNTAMRVLLDKRNEDRLRSEENIRVNLVQLIEPYLDRLAGSELNPTQRQLLDVIRMNLTEVTGSPMPELSTKYYIFSPGELQVANLIRKGRTTKEMAHLLNISPRTVESYRNSIRTKLGLKHKRVNLKTYLSSKQ